MAITHVTGPMMIGNDSVPVNGYQGDYNPDTGPTFGHGGFGWSDGRWRWGGGTGKPNQMFGFQGTNMVPVLNVAPAASSASCLAAAQVPTAGTALTLVTTSASGVTVLSATTVYPGQQTAAAGSLALDGAPGLLQFGQSQGMVEYDPTKALGRAVVATWSGADTASGYVTVAGLDTYGYAMTEKLAGASGTTTSGAKAFKIITSATPGGTLTGSNVSLGTLDIFGLPLRADNFAFVEVTWNSQFAIANTGFVAAVTTTATSTTGDVRGTYHTSSAADGTKILTVFVTPNPVNVYNSGNAIGLFGVTQA